MRKSRPHLFVMVVIYKGSSFLLLATSAGTLTPTLGQRTSYPPPFCNDKLLEAIAFPSSTATARNFFTCK